MIISILAIMFVLITIIASFIKGRNLSAQNALINDLRIKEQTNSPSNRSSVDLDGITAKAALLELMRSKTSPFEGADPTRFEKIEFVDKGEGKFRWGAFTIDIGQKTYWVNVDAETAFWSYHGKFLVDPAGRWKAENLSKQHGNKY
jgi:hypothetical protein